MSEVQLIWEIRAVLGEGPVWVEAENAVYWVDIMSDKVHRYALADGAKTTWSFDFAVTSLNPRRDGGFIGTIEDGFAYIDFDVLSAQPVQLPEADRPGNRFNDGKVDNSGRYWAGTMDIEQVGETGSLYRLDPDLSVTKVDGGIICTNGPCWSPDDKTFYLADSFQEEFWAYDYDIETGSLSNKRVFASTGDDAGVADGSTVDEEGCLWNAQVIGGELVRYAPDGSVERRIGMPVKNVTSVMFGGDDLDVLYVTSMARVQHPAVHDMFAVEAKPQFLAGGLFAVTGLGIRGIPEPRFAG